MNEIILTLKPKEVIAFYNKKFIQPYLETQKFQFNQSTLEYHRNLEDFKQVIWHRCSKNNMSGHIIDFEMGYSIKCPRFRSWYKRRYGKDPVGGDQVVGWGNEVSNNNWNGKYCKRIGLFGYDLINKDIDDQFAVILENLKNVIIPCLDYYNSFVKIIDNPMLTDSRGEFEFFSQGRQIEHCLYLGLPEKARMIANSLINSNTIPTVLKGYVDTELKRIFMNQ